MIPLVRTVKPRRIVEVGVHKAKRASKLCQTALEYGPVHYVGFDVFETMDAGFHADALNGKGISTEAHARATLDDIAKQYPGFTYELIVGDTRETLHKEHIVADFVFIDGDHRLEVITGDYLALWESRMVVFDDYYTPGANGEMPDVRRFGCNALVTDLILAGHTVEIIPDGDRCNHGGISHLALVWRSR